MKNLDGTELTREQLVGLAIEAGHDRNQVEAHISGHGEAFARSALRDLTRVIQHEKFLAGKLKLDTRTERNQDFGDD